MATTDQLNDYDDDQAYGPEWECDDFCDANPTWCIH